MLKTFNFFSWVVSGYGCDTSQPLKTEQISRILFWVNSNFCLEVGDYGLNNGSGKRTQKGEVLPSPIK